MNKDHCIERDLTATMGLQTPKAQGKHWQWQLHIVMSAIDFFNRWFFNLNTSLFFVVGGVTQTKVWTPKSTKLY
ncbi:MAG: hypothetical protein ABFS56_23055 [Pseudomonadota bacterium]